MDRNHDLRWRARSGWCFRTGIWVWAIIIGVLIVVWIFIGLTNLGKLNTVAMTALFILSLVLFKVIFLVLEAWLQL